MYTINKDELKESLSIEEISSLVAELGGEPIMHDGYFVSQTICHNHAGEGSHKLYYYENTRLFKCYTDCNGEAFDIYDLVRKQMTIKTGNIWKLSQAIFYVANFFGVAANFTEDNSFAQGELQDWNVFKKYDKLNEISEKQIVELKHYDDKVLFHLPRPIIVSWEKEGIAREIMNKRNICFDPINEGIVIPHYDINNNLVGIRERTLIKENEKYGKYMPAKINGVMYAHPLSFNLYNLNKSKDNIKAIKKVIIFEGEKGPLTYASYFGEDNDISVAVCGSNLINYQVQLLLGLGVEEIVIAFDKQFKEIGDDEFNRWTKKLTEIHKKYGAYIHISFMFDKWNMLEYKMSPIDNGQETFMELFKRRISL